MTVECCCRRPHEFQFCRQPIPTPGVATENAPSPNRRSARGRKRLPLLEARSDERVGMSATGVTVSRSAM